jgi:hypothetical protein
MAPFSYPQLPSIHIRGHLHGSLCLQDSNSSVLYSEEELLETPMKGPLCFEEKISSKTRQRNGRVRFSDDDVITRVPRREDLSPEELNAKWLSPEDYAELFTEIELTEAVMSSDIDKHLVDDELLCARGLNNMDNLVARAESNHFVQQLILQQIAHQIGQQGTWDDSLVAKVYRDCSQPAVTKAQNLAREDAQDAMNYLIER